MKKKTTDPDLQIKLRGAIAHLKPGQSVKLHFDPRDQWFIEQRMSYYNHTSLKAYQVTLERGTVRIECIAEYRERYDPQRKRWRREAV